MLSISILPHITFDWSQNIKKKLLSLSVENPLGGASVCDSSCSYTLSGSTCANPDDCLKEEDGPDTENEVVQITVRWSVAGTFQGSGDVQWYTPNHNQPSGLPTGRDLKLVIPESKSS